MKRFDLWKLSLLNVFLTPVRSVLTVLGFAIGIAAVLAVITLGEAGRIEVQREMGRLGIDRIRITAVGEGMLTRGTGEWLRQATNVETTELVYFPAQIAAADGLWKSITICGCEKTFLADTELVQGRRLWQDEWDEGSQSALMGKTLADQLQIQPGDCVYLAQQVFQICGIVSPGEGVSVIPVAESLLLPIDAACTLTSGVIQEIQTVSYPGLSIQNAQKLAEQFFTRTGDAVQTETMQVQMDAAASVIGTFVNVLKWVALVCILVGGIGIMNMLLVNVRDRRREIGIMKSLGTTPRQICTLFLLEALVYALSGGFLGIMLGNILIYIAGISIELTAQAGFGDCVTVFAAAMSIGLLFGVWPAFRASKLSCVDALRQE